MATKTPITAKRTLYTDFFSDFYRNPVSQDLARITNEEAVKQSIRNLLLTDKGERPYQPKLGSDIRKLLFENIMPDTVILAKQIIRETIETYEPRANLIGVDVLANPDLHTIQIIVVFNVINSEDDITLVTTLTRVR